MKCAICGDELGQYHNAVRWGPEFAHMYCVRGFNAGKNLAESEATRNAVRYQWLRSNGSDVRVNEKDGYGGTQLKGWEELDAAIDDAMSAKDQ